MGRYSTVQAFADTNPNMRKVTYEQAAGAQSTDSKKSSAVRPEKVDNPYGSTAGAGSGEFHVYRHARAREMMRMQELDEEEAKLQADKEFYTKLQTDREILQKKTEQRRKKRQREKEAKLRKKVMKLNGLKVTTTEEENQHSEDKEFEYTPTCPSPGERNAPQNNANTVQRNGDSENS